MCENIYCFFHFYEMHDMYFLIAILYWKGSNLSQEHDWNKEKTESSSDESKVKTHGDIAEEK